MTKPRKPRTDSTANLHRILAGANIDLSPPCHVPLKDEDWPFWNSLVEEFARADWTRHQLELAALLARSMSSLEAEQRAQRAEGSVLTKANGTSGPNPRNRVISTLVGQTVSMRRSLALTGRAKAGGRSEVAFARREANRRTERAALNGDELLA